MKSFKIGKPKIKIPKSPKVSGVSGANKAIRDGAKAAKNWARSLKI